MVYRWRGVLGTDPTIIIIVLGFLSSPSLDWGGHICQQRAVARVYIIKPLVGGAWSGCRPGTEPSFTAGFGRKREGMTLVFFGFGEFTVVRLYVLRR